MKSRRRGASYHQSRGRRYRLPNDDDYSDDEEDDDDHRPRRPRGGRRRGGSKQGKRGNAKNARR